ncbi:MAG: cyclic nucleotide-binding domain-containing protein [Verrucomicrobiota bacterium]
MYPRLDTLPIFAGLNDEALNVLAQRVQVTEAAPGTVLVREGENGNRFFLIESGAVRVCKHYGKPHETILATLQKGDFFGEMCILETLPRSATVLTVVPSVFYSLTSLDFLHLYERLPSEYGILVLNLARDLSRRLRHLDELFSALH